MATARRGKGKTQFARAMAERLGSRPTRRPLDRAPANPGGSLTASEGVASRGQVTSIIIDEADEAPG
ncbi:MAG: hypothetical protein LBW85_06405 [Deltaproteobacteria bacterium]|nr:hypothetical protein [Deltaproteobacteria bacterium]